MREWTAIIELASATERSRKSIQCFLKTPGKSPTTATD
jgi:hypothetical protein